MSISENQSAPKLENRKTSPCSPSAPNFNSNTPRAPSDGRMAQFMQPWVMTVIIFSYSDGDDNSSSNVDGDE